MAIEQADNVQTGAPKPTDSRYYNNLVPYTDETEANALIGSGVRYTGLTVNVAGTEYWYKEGITDPDLVIKESGGGTLNMSGSTVGGITTYVDATTICAYSGATYDGTTLGIKSQSVSSDSLCVINSVNDNMLLRVRENSGGNGQFNLYNISGVSGTQFTASGSSFICGTSLTIGGDVNIRNAGACSYLSMPAYINEDTGLVTTGSTLPEIYHTLGKLTPAMFPFIDGSYIVSAWTVNQVTYSEIHISIIPNGSFDVYYGYSGSYRKRTISSNITQASTFNTGSTAFNIFEVYLNYPTGQGLSQITGQNSSNISDTSYLAASVKVRNSGNIAGEILEVINWGATTFGTSGGTTGGITMNGSTVGGVTTYVDANTICAQDYHQIIDLPSFAMGAGAVTDEYLVLQQKWTGGTGFPAYGLNGAIHFQRGGTASGNAISKTNLTIQTAYNSNYFGKFESIGYPIWTSIDEIEIDSVPYYALKARTSGGGEFYTNQFVGDVYNQNSDANFLSCVRASDGNVTVITTDVVLPDIVNDVIRTFETPVCINGNIDFCEGATRVICVATAASGVGDILNLCAGSAGAGTNCGGGAALQAGAGGAGAGATAAGFGGYSIIWGGVGGAGDGTGGKGGRAIVRAGAGGAGGSTGGGGGDVEICGGDGYNTTIDGAGGDVCIKSGFGPTTDGTVYISHDTLDMMHTTTTGMCFPRGLVACTETTSSAGIFIGCDHTTGILPALSASNNGTSGGQYYGGIFSALHTGAGGRAHGILSYAGDASAGHNNGVIGMLCGTAGGAGIQGSVGAFVAGTGAGCYAGYFNGCVYSDVCFLSPVVCATTAFRTTGAGYRFCGDTGCGTAVDWVATSDCRIKKNIVPITSALFKVDALCGRCYELCEDGTLDMGLIAQEVLCVEPRLVSKGEAIEEYKKYGVEDELLSLKYDKFAGLFVEAIKELKQQNECLQKQINELKKN